MKIYNVLIVIFLIFSLSLGFSLFSNPTVYGSQKVVYKSFQKEGVSFKYPSSWKVYTSKMEPEAFVAVGDPKTVGFEGMDVPTTMVVINKNVMSADVNNSYSENYYSQKIVNQDVDAMHALESYATTPYDTFWSSVRDFIINTQTLSFDVSKVMSQFNNDSRVIWDPSRVTDVVLGPFFNNYTSYHQMNYNSQNSSLAGANSQEFTMVGVNTYTNHDEYSKVISFETKNGTEIILYTIMCSANSPDIEEAKKQFNIILKSLKLNQNSVMN